MVTHSDKESCRGFALLASIVIITILVLLGLLMFRFSEKAVVTYRESFYEERARANARVGMQLALAKLQGLVGIDQSVCAEASILQKHVAPAEVVNPHWLGVWNTYVEKDAKAWPVVGMLPENGLNPNAPYTYRHMYCDLREELASLKNDQWKDELRSGWLVSCSEKNGHLEALLNDRDKEVVMVGEGSLGASSGSDIYKSHNVTVPLVDIKNGTEITGRYGFWVGNNNLKANIAAEGNLQAEGGVETPHGYSQPDPILVESVVSGSVNRPFAHISDLVDGKQQRILSKKTLYLLGDNEKKLLKEKFHDFTNFSYGMHVDVVSGGFKRDLTPLLFGDKGSNSIVFKRPQTIAGEAMEEYGLHDFSTDFPMINSTRKTILGPRFDSLRSWGLTKYKPELENNVFVMDTKASDSDLRDRPSSWLRSISDGVTYDPASFSKHTFKISPVMSSVSWHFAYSFTGNGVSHANDAAGDSRLRFHIMPKVTLWNPYNVILKVPALIVLMPNILTREDDNKMRFEFYLEDAFVESVMKPRYPFLSAWEKTVVDGESLYKFSIGKSNLIEGGDIVPSTRYLGFQLSGVSFLPGECLVFSPDIKVENALNPSGYSLLQSYSDTNISSNLLSPHAAFGEHHFIHDVENGYQIRLGSNAQGVDLSESESSDFLSDVDFTRAFRYRFDGIVEDSMPFVLKACNGSGDVEVDTVAGSAGTDYPTIQIVNCADGGTQSDSWFASHFFVDPLRSDFLIQNSELDGNIEFPQPFQIGAKLISLDETFYEASSMYSFRGRYSKGLKPESLLFNYSSIGGGNVRAALATRAPHHFATRWWGNRAMGNWLLTHANPSPNEVLEIPFTSVRSIHGVNRSPTYGKSPLHEFGDFQRSGETVLFDLPDQSFGCYTISDLRHAHLSPYSWHPTYAVGNSLADLSSPLSSTANPLFENGYDFSEPAVRSSFDFYAGGVATASSGWSDLIDWGPETGSGISSDQLLFIGDSPITDHIAGTDVSSEDELLAYDVSFEVNQSLYDHYFFSALPILEFDGSAFDQKSYEMIGNSNHTMNSELPNFMRNYFEEQLDSRVGSESLSYGFWHSGFFLYCISQFNVNSTSVDAWVALLSSLRDSSGMHLISRTRSPVNPLSTDEIDEEIDGGLRNGRLLTDDEILLLARSIVEEVQLRGPFLSMADFVNRRLGGGKDQLVCIRGAIDAAIANAGLNAPFDSGKTAYTFKEGIKTGGRSYNVHSSFRPDYDLVLPKSKAVGSPSYLTQGDILQNLDAYVSVRGETFTIRSYGQSVEAGEIKAEAYLEAVVVRTPLLVGEEKSAEKIAKHVQKQIDITPVTGEYIHYNKAGASLGRTFRIKSFKWLLKSDI